MKLPVPSLRPPSCCSASYISLLRPSTPPPTALHTHTPLWSLGLLDLGVFVSLCLCTSVCPPLSVRTCVCLSCAYIGGTPALSLYILQVYALHWVEVPGGAPDSEGL